MKCLAEVAKVNLKQLALLTFINLPRNLNTDTHKQSTEYNPDVCSCGQISNSTKA